MNEIVFLDDLENANSKIAENMNEIADNLLKASEAINGFNSNTVNDLTGQGYNTIRTKLSLYASIYAEASKVVRDIVTNIENANNGVIGAMNGAYSVRCGKKLIDDIEEEIKNLKVENFFTLTGKEPDHIIAIGWRNAHAKYDKAQAELTDLLNQIKAVRAAIASGVSVVRGNSSAKGNLLGEIGSITVANL